MTWQATEEPVAHADAIEERAADPDVTAYVTTITMAMAHPSEVSAESLVANVVHAVEALGFEGIVAGVATVELRGPGGIVGL